MLNPQPVAHLLVISKWSSVAHLLAASRQPTWKHFSFANFSTVHYFWGKWPDDLYFPFIISRNKNESQKLNSTTCHTNPKNMSATTPMFHVIHKFLLFSHSKGATLHTTSIHRCGEGHGETSPPRWPHQCSGFEGFEHLRSAEECHIPARKAGHVFGMRTVKNALIKQKKQDFVFFPKKTKGEC